MATWKVTPGDGSAHSSLQGGINYDRHGSVDSSTWQIQQDERPFLEEVKRDREIDAMGGYRKTGMRKMATIPDIVAIEMLMKHHIDLHDPAFLQDTNNMKRLRTVLKQEYPHLLIAT